MLGLRPEADLAPLREHEAVASVSADAGVVRLRLHERADLGGLLRTIGERFEVASLRTEAVSLHEIYVRTVEEPDGAAATSTEVGA